MSNTESRPPRILGPDGQPLPAPTPPRLQVVRQVVLSFIGSGIALAVMGFLGRTWIERRFDTQTELLRHDLTRTLRDENARIGVLDTIEDRAFAVREAYMGVLQVSDKVPELKSLVSSAESFQRSVGSRRSLLAKPTIGSVEALMNAIDDFISEVKNDGRQEELLRGMDAIEKCLREVDRCVAQERTSVSAAAQPADAAVRPPAGR